MDRFAAGLARLAEYGVDLSDLIMDACEYALRVEVSRMSRDAGFREIAHDVIDERTTCDASWTIRRLFGVSVHYGQGEFACGDALWTYEEAMVGDHAAKAEKHVRSYLFTMGDPEVYSEPRIPVRHTR